MMTRSLTFKSFASKRSLKNSGSIEAHDAPFNQKCKERMEHYESRGKTLENSKDSLDLIYERKRGMEKSCSADFSFSKNKDHDKPVTLAKVKRDESLQNFLREEEFPRWNGLPRSVSDFPERLVRRGSGRSSRKDDWQLGLNGGVVVEVHPFQESEGACMTLGGPRKGPQPRSRSATIPRKWSEWSPALQTSTSTGGYFHNYYLLVRYIIVMGQSNRTITRTIVLSFRPPTI